MQKKKHVLKKTKTVGVTKGSKKKSDQMKSNFALLNSLRDLIIYHMEKRL